VGLALQCQHGQCQPLLAQQAQQPQGKSSACIASGNSSTVSCTALDVSSAAAPVHADSSAPMHQLGLGLQCTATGRSAFRRWCAASMT
jgi:hypothetical protein